MKIRSDILRNYQSLHIWTGIISGLFLFIAFYAGSLTMFKEAISAWAEPPQHVFAQVPADKRDLLIQQVLSEHPQAQKGFILNLDDPHHSPISWYEKGNLRELNIDAVLWHATLNEDGQLLAAKVVPGALAELIDMLHRTAGIPGQSGHDYLGIYVLGIASILYFLALVSGLIFLLPTLVKSLFALRTNKGESRFWLDSHNLIGITSLPFHLIICLTAIVFAFHDQFYDALGDVVYGQQAMFTRPAAAAQPYNINDLPSVNQLIETVTATTPNMRALHMTYMEVASPSPMVSFGLFDSQTLMRGPVTDYVFMQPYTGNIVSSSVDPSGEGTWSRIVASFFALHFGSFGGELGRWIYFIFGLSGAFVFYSGNLLWLEKRRKKKTNEKQTRSVKLMAATTIGVCLGSILALTMSMLAGKWLFSSVDNINTVYIKVYYFVFVASVGLAFWLGAAKSSLILLKSCALATLAIPLTSLLAIVVPVLGIWPANTVTTLGVDLVALCSSAAFYYAFVLAKRRAFDGPEQSIWSLKDNNLADIALTEKA